MKSLQNIKNRYGIIGRSAKLDRALSTAMRVANTDLTVLISGESGAGKEVFSKIIHSLSSRKHNDFIAINTGAIPEGTINSELFGHEKGSFTGAIAERKGYFETANGGTVFLDEISEMPMDTQAFLLRVLESGEFIRVGSSKVLKTDVRIIAASNVELEKKVRAGKFRDDLYYRLNTVPIKVPALKERREDIYMLFRKFAVDFAEKYSAEAIQLDQDARRIIENYRWPGNVRELRNIVEQLSILTEEKFITKASLLDHLPQLTQNNFPSTVDQKDEGNFKERELLYKVLFDLKNDLNDLKSLIFELIKRNDLEMPESDQLSQLRLPENADYAPNERFQRGSRDYSSPITHMGQDKPYNESTPVIVNDNEYDELEVVEENLLLENMEKEFIEKALKRHSGKRKKAAKELGISERTLYRKISYHDL